MDVSEAVKRAKTEFLSVFSNESTYPPTLEEVWFDEEKAAWNVTLGLRRGAEHAGALQNFLDPSWRRHRPEYKFVILADDDGRLIAIRDREFVQAA
jgi:hypothetical protein